MAVDAKTVKELRDRTGLGMGKCKEALEQVGGDLDKAVEFLRKAGVASAVKKESRATNEGRIEAMETSEKIVLVEANAETDFVVNNERFGHFHVNVCHELLMNESASLSDFMSQKYSKNPEQSIDDYRKEVVAVLGENIVVSRVLSITKRQDCSYSFYSHMGGKIVTVVEISGAADEAQLAKEIALHIAAEAPDYLSSQDIPSEIVDKEREIAAAQVKGKPENIIEKIVDGKLKAFYEQVCLLNQKFIKDPSITISDLVAAKGKAAGKNLSVTRFIRWQIGR
ncbi:MAG: elongation factor Ts [Chlamydiae bacterium]|nr:elongation factor Ts [Chlamydiota bacterium]